jgi:hypothetical protein
MRMSPRLRAAFVAASVLLLATACSGEGDVLDGAGQRGRTGGSPASSSSTTTTLPPLVNPPGRFLTGVVEPALDPALPTVGSFGGAVGRAPDLVSVFVSFAEPFPAERVAAIRARGATPMVTLEPWPSAPGVACQPPVTQCLASGAFDQVAAQWAAAAAASGGPLLLRFGHEPNLRHYPWGLGAGEPAAYVEAWHRMREVFLGAGATNVEWVWAFQAPGGPNPDPEPWFPGEEAIDWIAIDGYNGGTALDWGGWLSFEDLFALGLDAASRLAPKHPVMISETASATAGGDRAAWIRTMERVLVDEPTVCALVWFEVDKEADWSVGDHPPSAAALGGALDALAARDVSGTSSCA